ncbi:MAG: helix-turn-helix transcriptional regulator [Actinobacteria bacterium]|nr:helix-turn-helix transcriptional regulator [Actinomycetota bacterium]
MPESDPRLVALGRALRKARRARDLSQEAVGQRAGMHPNHVGTIERGTKDLRATTLLRLIEALEMSPAELFADYAQAGEEPPADEPDTPPQRSRPPA